MLVSRERERVKGHREGSVRGSEVVGGPRERSTFSNWTSGRRRSAHARSSCCAARAEGAGGEAHTSSTIEQSEKGKRGGRVCGLCDIGCSFASVKATLPRRNAKLCSMNWHCCTRPSSLSSKGMPAVLTEMQSMQRLACTLRVSSPSLHWGRK